MKTENDRPLPPNAPEEEWEFGEHTTCPECGTDCYALWEQQNRKAPLPPPQARTPPRAEINKWLDTRDDPFKILAQMRIFGNLAMVLEEWQKHLGVGAELAPHARTIDERISTADYELRQFMTAANITLGQRKRLEEIRKRLAESAPQEAPLEVINRWISQVENPDFGSVPSKKTLLELLGYVREEIAASKKSAPQEAGARAEAELKYAAESALSWMSAAIKMTDEAPLGAWVDSVTIDMLRIAISRSKVESVMPKPPEDFVYTTPFYDAYPELRAERGVPLEEAKNG